jgi:hypothetical protein
LQVVPLALVQPVHPMKLEPVLATALRLTEVPLV